MSKLNLTEDDKYLVKMLSAGFSLANVSKKLGVAEDVLKKRWEMIQASLIVDHSSGYAAFCDHINNSAFQYQLLGESFKITAEALSQRMTDDDLLKLIVAGNPEQTVKNLKSNCIILKPFVPLTPEESIKKTLAGN